jgi:hypothetical protein
MARETPFAQMELVGLGFFTLQPGEQAVVPVKWYRQGKERITECSTHPEAPEGLAVLPGYCDAGEYMSLVVENESVLPITVSEQDFIAVQAVQEEFCRSLDWSGKDQDVEKVIQDPKKDQVIVVIIHRSSSFRCML